MGKWTGKRVAVLYGGKSSERRGLAEDGRGHRQGAQEKGYDAVLVDVDARRRRPAARREDRGRLQRPPRPLGRGRLRPGAPRGDGDPVHRLRRRRLGHRDGQDPLEAPLRLGRPRRLRLPGLPRRRRREDPRGRPAVRPPLHREAGRRGLVGRRLARAAGVGADRRLPGGREVEGGRDRRAVREGEGGPGGRPRREGARRHRGGAGQRLLRLRGQVHRGDDAVLLPGADPGGGHEAAAWRPARRPTARSAAPA